MQESFSGETPARFPTVSKIWIFRFQIRLNLLYFRTSGKPFTAHTTNPVPFVLVNCHKAKGLEEDGKLCDIAPTLLDMMDLEQPKEMTGHSLLIK